MVRAEPGPKPRVLLGDKGYDADAIPAKLDARGVAAQKSRRTVVGFAGLRLSKLKHSRRLATRYDKTADRYLGFILVASTHLWIRHFVNRT